MVCTARRFPSTEKNPRMKQISVRYIRPHEYNSKPQLCYLRSHVFPQNFIKNYMIVVYPLKIPWNQPPSKRIHDITIVSPLYPIKPPVNPPFKSSILSPHIFSPSRCFHRRRASKPRWKVGSFSRTSGNTPLARSCCTNIYKGFFKNITILQT